MRSSTIKPTFPAWSVSTPKLSSDAGAVFKAGGPLCRRRRPKILDTYLEPDKSFVELREMAIDGTIDLLRGFSDACHDEFEEMRPMRF